MEGLGLSFVFERWLDPQMFTNHEATHFKFWLPSKQLHLKQGSFLHTRKEDHTGAVVWDDAVVLARYFSDVNTLNPGFFRKKTVVELGAGTGLPGIVLAELGAEVTLTDRDAVATTLIQENIAMNGLDCQTMQYEWGKDSSLGKFDILIVW